MAKWGQQENLTPSKFTHVLENKFFKDFWEGYDCSFNLFSPDKKEIVVRENMAAKDWEKTIETYGKQSEICPNVYFIPPSIIGFIMSLNFINSVHRKYAFLLFFCIGKYTRCWQTNKTKSYYSDYFCAHFFIVLLALSKSSFVSISIESDFDFKIIDDMSITVDNGFRLFRKFLFPKTFLVRLINIFMFFIFFTLVLLDIYFLYKMGFFEGIIRFRYTYN